MFGNCNHCCFCCGHPCTMLGVSLSISCKNKIQCVCVEKKKTILEGINSRITEAEERISDLEDRLVEFTAAEQNKEKRMKRNEDSLRDLWDNIKRNNIHIIGVPEGEKERKYLKRL